MKLNKKHKQEILKNMKLFEMCPTPLIHSIITAGWLTCFGIKNKLNEEELKAFVKKEYYEKKGK